MICQRCGSEALWMGHLSNLTHTECQNCGATDNQVVDPESDDDESEAPE